MAREGIRQSMKDNKWLSPEWETQIVALLLLFFLAHTALGETCGSLQADVRFNCKATSRSFVTETHPSDTQEWNETLNGGSSCVSLESQYHWEGFTSRQTAVKLPAQPSRGIASVVSYSNDSEISPMNSGVHVGDLMIGIKISRKPIGRIPGRGGGFTGFKTQATAFVKPVESTGVFVTSLKKGESVVPDVVVEGDRGAISTSYGQTKLDCEYQVVVP